MGKKICLVEGHPHRDRTHLCHGLGDAYKAGAKAAGHSVTVLSLANMDVPLLRDPADFETDPPADVLKAQKAVMAADHVTVIYPLWLGSMPALTKAFFEQLSRNSFAIAEDEKAGWPRQLLKGKSARVVVTMGMPAAAYRLLFKSHGVKAFERNVLGMSGFKPVKDTLLGGVGAISDKRAAQLFEQMRALGAKAE